MPLPGSQRLCTPFLRLGDEMIPWPSESGVVALQLSEFCGKVYQFCDRRVSKGAWNAFCISFWLWFLPAILTKMVVSGSGPGYKNCPQSGKEETQTFAPKKVPLFPFQPAVAGWCEMNGKGVVPFPLSCLKIGGKKWPYSQSSQSGFGHLPDHNCIRRLAECDACPRWKSGIKKELPDLLQKGRCIKNRRDSREVSRESRENLLHLA